MYALMVPKERGLNKVYQSKLGSTTLSIPYAATGSQRAIYSNHTTDTATYLLTTHSNLPKSSNLKRRTNRHGAAS